MATWHHGLVADWWALFNTEGPEIDYFGRYVSAGQPALDAGCGTGRLLVPWLRAGYDVDGADVSEDMIAHCRRRPRAAGHEPALTVQPLHELEMARRYRTVVVCGVFGLGTTREQDLRALRRLYDALEPGGTLLLDNEAPYADAGQWTLWTAEARADLPHPLPPNRHRTQAPDGTERELRSRALAADPLDQTITLELVADLWRDGDLVATEVWPLTMRAYFDHELRSLLAATGFELRAVHADYQPVAPTADTRFVIYHARKPGTAGG
jgi:SAM-dependent methyltransferase